MNGFCPNTETFSAVHNITVSYRSRLRFCDSVAANTSFSFSEKEKEGKRKTAQGTAPRSEPRFAPADREIIKIRGSMRLRRAPGGRVCPGVSLRLPRATQSPQQRRASLLHRYLLSPVGRNRRSPKPLFIGYVIIVFVIIVFVIIGFVIIGFVIIGFYITIRDDVIIGIV